MTVSYEVAKPFDSGEVIRLLAGGFSTSEPPAVAMGSFHGRFERFLDALPLAVIPEELTLVAHSVDTGRLVGVLLTDDFGNPPGIDLGRISPKFCPSSPCWSCLMSNSEGNDDCLRGQWLHLFMLAVDRRIRGKRDWTRTHQKMYREWVSTRLPNGADRGDG